MRAYALERLEAGGEGADLRRRHAEYYAALAIAADKEVWEGGSQPVVFARLAAEHDNLRVALAWLAEAGEAELELRFARALVDFWRVRGFPREGYRQLEEALERGAHLEPTLLAQARTGAASLAFSLGEYGLARALREENLAVYEELGDESWVARMQHELASTYLMEQNYSEAARLYDRSIESFRAADDTLRLGIALANRAETALAAGDSAACRALASEALTHQERWADTESTAITLQILARAALLDGARDEARDALGRAADLAVELGHREVLAYCLEGFAELAAPGEPAEAAILLGAADALLEQVGAVVQGHQREAFAELGSELANRLGDTAMRAGQLEGQQLTPEQAVALARKEKATT